MKFFPSNIRLNQRVTDQPNPKEKEPNDAKEILLLSSGILVLTLGVGGLLMFSEEEPTPATASHPVGQVEFAKAFSPSVSPHDQSGSSPQPPTLLPEVEAHSAISTPPLPTMPTVPPSSESLGNCGFSQAGLTEEGKAILSAQVAHLPKDWEGSLHIQGHTDLRGPDSYNRALGAKRAEAVKTYLVSLGIPQDHIQTDSFGKDAPLCQEDTPVCHKQNRRVQVEWLNSPVAHSEEPVIPVSSPLSTEVSRLNTPTSVTLAETGETMQDNPTIPDSPVQEESTPELVTSEVVASPEAQP